MKCLLCGSNNLLLLEVVKRKDLISLYRAFTKEDFSYLITQDIKYIECQECKLIFFYPVIVGDEKFYNSLQKFRWYYMDEKEEYYLARNFIKSSDKVLEVGCGKGAFAKLIHTKDYIGLELSTKAKELANKEGILVENETIESFSDKHPEEFDIVCSFQVLEHVANPKSFLEAKLKALKQGGIMIVGVPSEDSFLKYATNAILNMPPHHVTRWSNKTLKYVASKYDLELLSIYHEKVQKYHEAWFVNTILLNTLFSPKLIDTSLKFKIASKITSILSRILVKGFKDEMLPAGHTVVAVYRKK